MSSLRCLDRTRYVSRGPRRRDGQKGRAGQIGSTVTRRKVACAGSSSARMRPSPLPWRGVEVPMSKGVVCDSAMAMSA